MHLIACLILTNLDLNSTEHHANVEIAIPVRIELGKEIIDIQVREMMVSSK